MEETLLTIKDVALKCKVTEGTIWRWIKSGQLRGTRIGRSWRVRPQALEEYLQQGERECLTTH